MTQLFTTSMWPNQVKYSVGFIFTLSPSISFGIYMLGRRLLPLHCPVIGEACLVQVMSPELAGLQGAVVPLSNLCCSALGHLWLTSVTSNSSVYTFLFFSCLCHFHAYGNVLHRKLSCPFFPTLQMLGWRLAPKRIFPSYILGSKTVVLSSLRLSPQTEGFCCYFYSKFSFQIGIEFWALLRGLCMI